MQEAEEILALVGLALYFGLSDLLFVIDETPCDVSDDLLAATHGMGRLVWLYARQLGYQTTLSACVYSRGCFQGEYPV